MGTTVDDSPKTGLNDIISAKEMELEKINDKISQYDDPTWIQERKQKLEEKREIIEQELMILQGAQSQLKRTS